MSQQPPSEPAQRVTHYMKPHRGTMILVFGILGIMGVCVIFSILAWVMGNGDLKEMEAGLMDPSGREMTNVGRILGMVSCILAMVAVGVICLVYGCMFVLAAGAAGTAGAGGGY